VHRIIRKAKKEKRSLLETEAKELLKEYGIPVPDFKLIKSEDEIAGLAKEINFPIVPIVMKIVSPDIIHKTDAGGVKVGIKTEKEARIAYQEIIFEAKKYNKKAKISGVIVYLSHGSSRGRDYYRNDERSSFWSGNDVRIAMGSIAPTPLRLIK
jgi:acetyl-CoA synthetase (ADP-forming)